MPQDDPPHARPSTPSTTSSRHAPQPSPQNSSADARKPMPPPTSQTSRQRTLSALTSIPRPLKTLFDRFPLHTYAPNTLPARSPSSRSNRPTNGAHTLYIFTTSAGAATGAPSYNPGCLKWQTVLKFHGIPFDTRVSTNHAAPGGVLPFLIPAPSPASSNTATPSPGPSTPPPAIPASKLESWLRAHSSSQALPPGNPNPLLPAYHTLLTPLRHAYLHALYLHPPTFLALAEPLYIAPCSHNAFVRAALSHPLRAAALEQLVLGAPGTGGAGVGARVDVDGVYEAADAALEALSVILGRSLWFASAVEGGGSTGAAEEEKEGRGAQGGNKGSGQPGMLDAAVFAYTHVVLEYFSSQDEGSPARRLAGAVTAWPNLVAHRERVLGGFYGR